MTLAKTALLLAALSIAAPSWARPHRPKAQASRKHAARHEKKPSTKNQQAKLDKKDPLAGLPGF